MSLLRRATHPSEERAIPTPTTLAQIALDLRNSGSVSEWSAGQIDTALRHPTVWRSVNKVANMYVQMPLHSRIGNRIVEPQPPMVTRPSVTYRPSAWKRTAATSMLLKGGAYGLTSEPGPRGQAEWCELIHPDRVTWSESQGWMIDNKPAPPEWPLGNFWQVPLMTLPGSPKGVNPIEYARRTTYAGMAAAEFGGNFFRDGAHPTTIIAPESDPGEKGAEALKERIRNAVSGTDRDPIIVPQSVKWHQIQINPDDSQFIELMQFSGGQLAGFFGLDPSHVGLPVEGGSMDYSNRENRQQDILQDAVMQVVIPLDEAITELVPNGQTVKASPEGLLRADLAARYASYEVAARIKQATGQTLLDVNTEMRPLENREPLVDNDATGSGGPKQASARDIAEVIQKIYLGVGVVITEAEARAIINREGVELAPGPMPTNGAA